MGPRCVQGSRSKQKRFRPETLRVEQIVLGRGTRNAPTAYCLLLTALSYLRFAFADPRPGRVYLMGRFLGSIFITPVPFFSSRI